MSRERFTLRPRSLSPHTFSASMARFMAALAQATAGGKSFAKPHNSRKSVNDAELSRPARHRHQQAAIIGAKIEGSEGRSMVDAGRRPTRPRRNFVDGERRGRSAGVCGGRGSPLDRRRRDSLLHPVAGKNLCDVSYAFDASCAAPTPCRRRRLSPALASSRPLGGKTPA